MKKILVKKLVSKLSGISHKDAHAIFVAYNQSVQEAILEGHKVTILGVITLEAQFVSEGKMYCGFLKKEIVTKARFKLKKTTSQILKDKIRKKPVYGQ